jgi:sigma-B regulation protein RsbQ
MDGSTYLTPTPDPAPAAEVRRRHHVTESGPADGQPMLFAHGFGCDQHMWRHVAPAFADEFRVVLFDHVGAGSSDLAAYDPARYAALDGYADDVVAIVEGLDLHDVVFVGHSVSAMIGVLAERKVPERFDKLVLVGPSPCYIDGEGYVGGFSERDIHELLDSLDSNYLGWSSAMAPVIVGNADRPELGRELTESFCRTDPEIARAFARATFLTDSRADLPGVGTPTLVLQCSDDVIAPVSVGQYVADAIPGSTLVQLAATGHCPQLSEPAETTAAISGFVRPAKRAARTSGP